LGEIQAEMIYSGRYETKAEKRRIEYFIKISQFFWWGSGCKKCRKRDTIKLGADTQSFISPRANLSEYCLWSFYK